MWFRTLFRWSLRTLIIFVLLAGSIIGLVNKGIGAWALSKLVPPVITRQLNSQLFLDAEFSFDSRYIICTWVYRFEPCLENEDRIIISCWDVGSGKKKWDSRELNGNIGELKAVDGKHSMLFFVDYLGTNLAYVIDLDNGSVNLHDRLTQAEYGKTLPIYSPDGRHYVKLAKEEAMLYLISPHRPSDWYEIAWIPEVWLMGLFSMALIFSLRRDWKERKAKS